MTRFKTFQEREAYLQAEWDKCDHQWKGDESGFVIDTLPPIENTYYCEKCGAQSHDMEKYCFIKHYGVQS